MSDMFLIQVEARTTPESEDFGKARAADVDIIVKSSGLIDAAHRGFTFLRGRHWVITAQKSAALMTAEIVATMNEAQKKAYQEAAKSGLSWAFSAKALADESDNVTTVKIIRDQAGEKKS